MFTAEEHGRLIQYATSAKRKSDRQKYGTPGGTRTPDAQLRTLPLYPLSYRGMMRLMLVETGGIEPPTSALRTPRSPN